ncbi:MAG: dehydrogenase [Verrucomicrobia bacterium]|nr:MAG: dehydrogenase [Verrucomicrobiota bacterium]
MSITKRLLVTAASLAVAWGLHAAPASFNLQPGDHVALVGGAVADRFQHTGYLEALVLARFPDHNLVFRNLAVAGDEVVTRHRSENFGSPEDWLRRTKADVILAFFGANEAAQGPVGIRKFRDDLDHYVKDVRSKDFSGRGNARLVLFSPAAEERHPDPNFPDPTPMNANRRLYAEAIAEVAKANDVPFVDLFSPSVDLYAAAVAKGQALTINGHLLGAEGDRQIANVIYKGLFGAPAPELNLEKLRAAINEKNAIWHSRYRTVDGYNVYGGRSALAYQPEKGGFISDRNAPAPYVSNYKVMQEEMAVRDTMTANRDVVVWAAAKGREVEPNDSNLPKVTPVLTNKRGQNPDGSHVFLGGEEAIAKMTVHSGMKVNLFASEERFPELVKPLQMAWDAKGRLWVAAWLNYPERTPDSKTGDSLLVFEDTDGDGKADKCTHFADDLNAPTGFQFYKDGVLLVQAPDLWYLRDTDGDGKADTKERVLMGLDSADSHHTSNAVALDPGGSIYLSDGVFHRTQVESAEGPVRNDDGAILRFEPRTGKFEVYAAYGFANPHGKVFDRWGNDFVTDATGNNTYFAPAFSGHIDYPAKHSGMREFWPRPSRPCPGTTMISSRHFPEEFQGNFINLNVIGFQGIYRVKVSEEGSGLKGETLENIVSSTDPNFRPICASIGPDGALYFCDWSNAIIGHMQHHLRDPNRDHLHGRIYRMTYPGRPLLKQPPIAGQPIPALLELLKEPENGVRELAKVELGARDSAAVIDATKVWAANLSKSDAEYAHHLTEALWVHQWHNVVDVGLLKSVLALDDHRARAAATRVLCYWRDRVPNALVLLKGLAQDEHPRVRLEAVRAASFFRDALAADVALAALTKPTDYYLDYTMRETLRQLEKWWRPAIAAGVSVAAGNPAGVDYLIKAVSTPELLKMPRTAGVLGAVLRRPDVLDADRGAALMDLAKLHGSTRAAELLGLAESADAAAAPALGRLLPQQSPKELVGVRDRLAALATGSPRTELREGAWAALAVADDGFDRVWNAAKAKPGMLADLLNGLPTILDTDLRAKPYARLKPLLADPATGNASGGGARFVRIELPRSGTLTLAEVQVVSGDRNVALAGTATQSSTSNGGEAKHAIDGNTDGSFGSNSQTHTAENENHPWWEVDLGREYPVESVKVFNRTENNGAFEKRLDGFTLLALDAQRRPVFQKAGIPAPHEPAVIPVGANAGAALKRAAIRALVSMGQDPAATFASMATLIHSHDQVNAAARGVRAIPRAAWPKTQAGGVATDLIAWARTVPATERTSTEYVETIQLADDLAGILDAPAASALRADLKGLRVAVFVVRTVREQMRFDNTRLVVEAGKPFEVVFENGDFMPHNFAFVKPGTREKVGAAAALMKPDEFDNRGRAFFPKTADLWAGTKLLEAGQREVLKLKAPDEESVHEFVCTFPGHALLMWGQLVVTRDVDAYIAAHPAAPEIKPAAGDGN